MAILVVLLAGCANRAANPGVAPASETDAAPASVDAAVLDLSLKLTAGPDAAAEAPATDGCALLCDDFERNAVGATVSGWRRTVKLDRRRPVG